MKNSAAGALPLKEGKRKNVGLKSGWFLLLGGFYIAVPSGAKSLDFDVIAACGGSVWVDWHETPGGMVGIPAVRKPWVVGQSNR